ncbi:unnamed protein product [Sphenostylis stenocarpa]|uniref:Uncharacterized protein n=1 Tax=Sphenostylis stenocarpa TaxID=92480 RepID=A0AA86V2A1_9FABA|nr:unnamed protein product [Sphenostylis stenocarpa]
MPSENTDMVSSNVFACTAFDRDGKRFPRCIFPHSIGSVPYLTFIARRASRFALDPLIYRIFAPTKRPEQGLGGKNAFPESHWYNLFFISKEDEAKIAFRCPGAVGRTILLAEKLQPKRLPLFLVFPVKLKKTRPRVIRSREKSSKNCRNGERRIREGGKTIHNNFAYALFPPVPISPLGLDKPASYSRLSDEKELALCVLHKIGLRHQPIIAWEPYIEYRIDRAPWLKLCLVFLPNSPQASGSAGSVRTIRLATSLTYTYKERKKEAELLSSDPHSGNQGKGREDPNSERKPTLTDFHAGLTEKEKKDSGQDGDASLSAIGCSSLARGLVFIAHHPAGNSYAPWTEQKVESWSEQAALFYYQT